jgi:hypothetical protein
MQEERASVLARWARAIADNAHVQPLPLRLCLACARLLGADGAAVTLAYTATERVTLCVTDAVAGRLEALQDILGQGPGPDAYQSGEPVVAALGDRTAAGRWPVFHDTACAAAGPDKTLYAFPIRPQGVVLGVLTLHQRTLQPLRYGLADAQFLADTLGAAVLRDPDSMGTLTRGPWASRARVHQATGMIIAQLGIGPEDALAVLRAHAYAHDASLDLIAEQVVARRLDFSPDDTGPGTGGIETR